MAAEQKPRWFARQMDFERWKRDIRAMGRLLPAMDTPTSTAVGAAIAFALAWVGEIRASTPDTLQKNFYGLAAIFSVVLAVLLHFRNRADKERLVVEAERICKDIDEVVEEWNENGASEP